MRSLSVAVDVFSRWQENSSTLRIFIPQEDDVASSHDAKVLSVDKLTGIVSFSLDGGVDARTWDLSTAIVEYVDASEDEQTPEELRRDFAGKFLKVKFPRQLFVIGELSN